MGTRLARGCLRTEIVLVLSTRANGVLASPWDDFAQSHFGVQLSFPDTTKMKRIFFFLNDVTKKGAMALLCVSQKRERNGLQSGGKSSVENLKIGPDVF